MFVLRSPRSMLMSVLLLMSMSPEFQPQLAPPQYAALTPIAAPQKKPDAMYAPGGGGQ